MTVINPPGFLQNAGATHTAEQFRDWHGLLTAPAKTVNSLIPRGGVNPAMGFSLQVTQTGSPSMAVLVRSGMAAVPGSEGTKQGVYSVLNDADVTLSISAAHATLNRIDIVCFKVEDQAYSGAVNTSSLVVVTGTPAASPSAPAAPNNSLTLASVSIVANDTSITNGEITDLRSYLSSPGGILSIKDATENAVLGVYQSLAVYRRDVQNLQIWDGGGFRQYWPIYRDSQTLGGSAGAVTFLNVASNLKTVRIRWTARGDAAVVGQTIRMRINNDSGNNYAMQQLQATGASVVGAATAAGAISAAICGVLTGASATAGVYAMGTIDLAGWDSPHSTYLGYTSHAGHQSVGGQVVNTASGAYTVAGPYTRIDLIPESGSFVAGSEFVLEASYF